MGTELHDNRGLICGLRLQAQERAVDVELSAVDARDPPQCPIWLHFNFNDTRARDWISDCAWLSAESRDSLLSSDHSVRLEALGNGIAGVLADVFADDPDSFGVFHLYVDQSCLITGRHHPATAVGLLRQDLDRGIPIDRTGALLTRLLGHLATSFGKIVAAHGDVIDDAEDRVLAGGYRETNLGQHRRAMARLRRQVIADRHALADLSGHPPSWWDKRATKELRQVAGALTSIAQDLELAQERARLLSEEIDSRLAERTNRNLYFVSVAAAVFLPITLISGIFGMNVGGLPWLEDPNGFKWTMGCMLAAVAIALALVHWRRML
jgi:zinc transporter